MRAQSGLSQHLRKRLRLIETEEVLYRDEEYFRHLEKAPKHVDIKTDIPEVGQKHLGAVDSIPTMTSDKSEDQDPGPLVKCKVCGRNFISDRISTHSSICQKTTAKPRPIFDVASSRIQGTEAEELVKSGRVQIEPAKPFEKKSELMKKYSVSNDATDPKKVAASAKPREPKAKMDQTKNGAAYQVIFENDKMKTSKASAGIPLSKLPAQMVRQGTKTDLRYLSAKNWKRARQQVSPDYNSSGIGSIDSFDDENDFLASSMTSQKTVCSDAFDFLFDETNLNPEKVLQLQNGDSHSVYEGKPGEGKVEGQAVPQSGCCTIS